MDSKKSKFFIIILLVLSFFVINVKNVSANNYDDVEETEAGYQVVYAV